MTHRVDDPHRIRLGHQHHVDEKVSATENAYRAIAKGEYRDERRFYRDRQKPAKSVPQTQPTKDQTQSGETFEQVRIRWAREAVRTRALSISCDHAQINHYCWPSVKAFCGPRINAAMKEMTR